MSFAAASSWPEADALFHADPRWLGADDAYSIALDDDTTLWLFGDTFIGDGARADAAFIRNSIAIQRGRDPLRADISFHWRAGPSSFFAPPPPPSSLFGVRGDTWLWPLHGARLAHGLLLFFMHVRSTRAESLGPIEDWRAEGPLGFFDVFGAVSLRIENPGDSPDAWRIQEEPLPGTNEIVMGAAVLAEDGYVYVYGWRARNVFVARRPAAGERYEWWCGIDWRSHGEPVPMFDDGTTEFTVHRDCASGRLLLVQTANPKRARIAVRWSDAPQGPWSAPEAIFTPPESERADAFTYAAKAHPQLLGADLVLTYASNATADVTLKDDTLYFPRFVRATRTDAP